MGPTLFNAHTGLLLELTELEKSRRKGKMRSGHPGSKRGHGETKRIKKIAKMSRKRNRR